MFEFSKKILTLLICVYGLIDGSEQLVVVKSNTELEKGVVAFSRSEANGDVNAQRTKRNLLDQILYGLFDYLDYSNEDESEEDEKYLICRNCTILISHENPPIQTTMVPTYLPTTRNDGVKPVSSTTNAPATTAQIITGGLISSTQPTVSPNGAPSPMEEP